MPQVGTHLLCLLSFLFRYLCNATQIIIGDTGSIQLEFGILAVWFVGVLILLAFYWCGGYRLRQVQHFAMLPSKNIQDLFDKCCQKLRIREPLNNSQQSDLSSDILKC